jgi:hypothetical protein
MVSELKRGKRRRDNVVLVGELKAATDAPIQLLELGGWRRTAAHGVVACRGAVAAWVKAGERGWQPLD